MNEYDQWETASEGLRSTDFKKDISNFNRSLDISSSLSSVFQSPISLENVKMEGDYGDDLKLTNNHDDLTETGLFELTLKNSSVEFMSTNETVSANRRISTLHGSVVCNHDDGNGSNEFVSNYNVQSSGGTSSAW